MAFPLKASMKAYVWSHDDDICCFRATTLSPLQCDLNLSVLTFMQQIIGEYRMLHNLAVLYYTAYALRN